MRTNPFHPAAPLRRAGIVLLSGLALTAGLACADDSPRPSPGAGGRAGDVPVVVELFTSEGCSSCPPADAVLEELARTQPVKGASVVALGWHVDYWDRLGWRDPSSSPDATRRQQAYAAAAGSEQVYTPQMIVDGTTELVGSDREKATDAVTRAAAKPKAVVRLVPHAADAAHPDEVAFDVRVADVTAAAGDAAEVLLAVTEDGLHSDVRRGENAGRSLDHVAVVRTSQALGELRGGAFEGKARFTVGKGWDRRRMRAVVLVQERQTRRVLAVGVANVAGE